MSILTALHIEPVFRAFQERAHWRRDASNRTPKESPEQTLLSYYALRAKDLPELLREAWSLEARRPIESLMSLLERRLDNVVFRMGFAGSILEARSIIAKGFILVNRYRPRSVRMKLWPGDVIHLARTPRDQQTIPIDIRRGPLPPYLQYLNSWTTDRGIMLSLPGVSDSPVVANLMHQLHGESLHVSA